MLHCISFKHTTYFLLKPDVVGLLSSAANDARMAHLLTIRKGVTSGSYAKDLEWEGLSTIAGCDPNLLSVPGQFP